MENSGFTPEWTRLISTPEDQRIQAVFEYCESFITQQKEYAKSEEQVGYAICGINGAQFELPQDVEQLLDMACDLEIGRDTKYFFGEGVWNQKDADNKKQKQYEEFLRYYDQLRTNYFSE